MSQSGERARRRSERAATDAAEFIPTVETSRAALHDLVALWPDSKVVRVPYMDDSWVRAGSIWVQAEHAVRTAQAILLLDDNKMFIQCGPLARQVLECGTTAAWMVKTPFSGQAVFADAKKKHQRVMLALAQMTGQPVPEQDYADEWDSYYKQAKDMEQRARVVDDGVWIYPYFRLLSGFSHGDGSLVQTYLETLEEPHVHGHQFQFRDPEQFPYREAVLALTVVMVHIAMLAWDHVSEDHALREPLRPLAKKHGLRVDPFTKGD